MEDKPKATLARHCTVHVNTLYALRPDAGDSVAHECVISDNW